MKKIHVGLKWDIIVHAYVNSQGLQFGYILAFVFKINNFTFFI